MQSLDLLLGFEAAARHLSFTKAGEELHLTQSALSRQIKDLLLHFVRQGGTVFLTSHVLEVVERLCDHIGIIHKGRLVAQAPLAELRAATAGGTLESMFLELVGASGGAAPRLDWLGG